MRHHHLQFSNHISRTEDSNGNVIYEGSILNESQSKVIGEYFISRNDHVGVGQIELNLYDGTSEEPIPLDLNKLNGIDLEDYLRVGFPEFKGSSGIKYKIT